MADQQPLAADEKLCPYCAEVIKRAAIRCRYCHSDLPETTAPTPPPPPPPASTTPSTTPSTTKATTQATTPTAAVVDDEVRGDAGEDAVPVPWWGGFRVTLVLLALCLVLAGVTVLSVERSRHPSAGKGPITSTSARENALTEAATLTQRVLSYNWQTLDADMKAAEAVSAPTFRAEYTKAMSGVRAQTVKNQVKLTASAVATSVVSASDTKVVALVFVNQVTTAKGTTNQRLDQNRVLVTLTRDGGEWRVSKMDAF